jgi:hypothetical protein
MSSKKESSLQVVAALLGIIASVVALHDWYDKRTADAPQHSASAMFRLQAPGAGAEQAAGPVTEAPSARGGSRSAAPQGVAAPAMPVATPAPPTTAAPAVPVASPSTTAPATAASALPGAPAQPASSVAAPAPTAPAAAAPPRPAAADPFLALVNAPAEARAGTAVSIRGEGGARLLSGLEQRGVGVMRGFFRDGFAQSSYFSQLLAGNGSALHRSGALAAGGRVLVGELQASYEPAELGLVVCNLVFSYVVLDARGARVARGTINVSVAGDDNAAAREAAIARLLDSDHGATLVRHAGG